MLSLFLCLTVGDCQAVGTDPGEEQQEDTANEDFDRALARKVEELERVGMERQAKIDAIERMLEAEIADCGGCATADAEAARPTFERDERPAATAAARGPMP